jgi:hypothetical protein
MFFILLISAISGAVDRPTSGGGKRPFYQRPRSKLKSLENRGHHCYEGESLICQSYQEVLEIQLHIDYLTFDTTLKSVPETNGYGILLLLVGSCNIPGQIKILSRCIRSCRPSIYLLYGIASNLLSFWKEAWVIPN